MAQIYVDDIVFEATLSNIALSFVEEMKKEYEMSIDNPTLGSLACKGINKIYT